MMEILYIKDRIIYAYIDSENSELIKQAKNLRHDVYVACDFIQPTETRTIEDRLDADCYYLVALDDNHVIGTIRLAKPPFKVLEVLKKKEKSLYPSVKVLVESALESNSVELGALAVRPKLKTGKSHISGGLYKAVYLLSLRKEIKYWLIDVDVTVGEALWKLGWKLIPLASEHEYMGSVTVPAIMPVDEQLENIKMVNPVYSKYILGC